jgi:preprotein translocase subunit SecG
MIFVLPGAGPVATTALVLVQQPGSGDNGGQGEDFGKSSPVGFLLLLVFLIAVAFLVRSMTKHLKRVPASFDNEESASAKEPESAKEPGEGATAESAKQPEKTESS